MFLLEIKTLFFSAINAISAGDPTVKGFATLWFLGVFSWLARNLPARIFTIIKNNSVISITLNKDGDIVNYNTVVNFEKWLIENNKFVLRNRTISSDDQSTHHLIGYGIHYVFCEGRILKVSKNKEKSNSTSSTIFESLTITTIGRTVDFFDKILKKSRPDSTINYLCDSTFRSYRDDENIKKIAALRDLPFISINTDVKNKIDDILEFFINNKEWYIKHNRPYKLVLVLHGPSGTGKSSLIRYIAKKINSDILDISPDFLSSVYLKNTFRKFSDRIKPIVCAVEDFEQHALSREYKENLLKKRKANQLGGDLAIGDDDEDDKDYRISAHNDLSGLLNLLQGIQPLENTIIVLTTNYPERVDEAVMRNGRVDHKIEIGLLNFEAVKRYFEYSYNRSFPDDIIDFKPIKACDMEKLFTDNPFSPEGFLKDSESYQTKA